MIYYRLQRQYKQRSPCGLLFKLLAQGIDLYHGTQLDEGMDSLIEIPGAIARKYCGGGYGGYALYLFESPVLRDNAIAATPELRAVEPFCRV